MAPSKAVVARNITKMYEDKTVLRNISLDIENGVIFGLLGPNGAGKSTLMEIIVGLRKPNEGRVFIKDYEVGVDEDVKYVIGFVPQEPMLYRMLTGYDNIKFFADLYGLSKKDFIDRLSDIRAILDINEEILGKRVDKLSGGQVKKIAIAASLITDPDVLVLDEPTTGLDPNVRREFWNFILELNNRGKTIILSTHYMEEADELCDDVAIIDMGRIIARGHPDKLKEKYGGGIKLCLRIKTVYMDEAYMLLEEYDRVRYPDRIVLNNSSERDIPRIRQLFREGGIPIESIEFRNPTLDDVFRNLTGRGLIED